jgi:hypothetical protein
MIFTPVKIAKGTFILYREKSSPSSVMTPARLQSDFAPMLALCDVTGIKPRIDGQKARIICGPVKWMHSRNLTWCPVSEDALLSAPTVEGVRE